jgi:NADPH:quinone reductase-like Zn-dependent oxidoreductase
MTIYQVGDAVRLQATFRSLDGVNTDPTAVSVKVLDPGGTITTYTLAGGQVVKAADGVFRYTLSLTVAGLYTYKWFGTGTVQAASRDMALEAQQTAF